MINLSRNKPVAFVVGVAGFLGSNIAEKLLSKNIQVVGIDDFSTGSKENLEEVSKNRDFHLINQSASEPLTLEFLRLDYGLFVLSEKNSKKNFLDSLNNFLNICHEHKAKVVFASSISLYDNHHQVSTLKEAEEKIAHFSFDNQMNARIVRLAPVYGPRMHFREEDPIFRLIQAATADKVKDEEVSLDFTSRSIYIDDAADLFIKALMHGSTAQKIYDGARENPLSVSEIKQVLIDPVWHEKKGFKPTDLSSWPTPNLLKTEKELAWKCSAELINSLKNTVQYLRKRPPEAVQIKESDPEEKEKILPLEKEENKAKEKLPNKLQESKFIKDIKHNGAVLILLVFIGLTIIYPLATVTIAAVTLKQELGTGSQKLVEGDFKEAQENIARAKISAGEIENNLNILKPLGKITAFSGIFDSAAQLMIVLNKTIEGMEYLGLGSRTLSDSYKIVSGETEGELDKFYSEADIFLDQAEINLSYAEGRIGDEKFIKAAASNMPILRGLLKSDISKLDVYVASLNESLKTAKLGSVLLSGLIPVEGKRNYLVLLFDNNIKRPGGGVMKSYIEIAVENGRISQVKADDVEELDKTYLEHLEPPKELKTDLGITEWRLGEAAHDIDFTKVAQNVQWLYQKETGRQVSGVIGLDIKAVQELSKLLGEAVDVNLVSSESDQQTLTAVFKTTIEKVLFSSRKNSQQLYKTIDNLAQEKDLAVYISEPTIYSYTSNIGWTASLSNVLRDRAGEKHQFLGLFESSLSETKIVLPQKEIVLESTIDEDGGVTHQLTVRFKGLIQGNESYLFNLKTYLQKGSKLTKVLWGEEDLTKKISTFSDYGMAGYSLNLELNGREEKVLIFEFEDMKILEFEGNKLVYNQEVVKQIGGSPDKLVIKLNLPSNIKALEGQTSLDSTTARDRNFRVTLQKSI